MITFEITEDHIAAFNYKEDDPKGDQNPVALALQDHFPDAKAIYAKCDMIFIVQVTPKPTKTKPNPTKPKPTTQVTLQQTLCFNCSVPLCKFLTRWYAGKSVSPAEFTMYRQAESKYGPEGSTPRAIRTVIKPKDRVKTSPKTRIAVKVKVKHNK